MKKYVKSDKYLAVLGCSLFVFLTFGIVALCLLNSSATVGKFTVSQLLFAVAIVAFVAYISTICVVAARKKSVRAYLELSVEAMLASVLLIGLSPAALMVWVIESVCENIAEKRKN